MGGNGDAITDVRSADEAVSSADDEASMPIHQIEGLCMSVERVKFFWILFFLFLLSVLYSLLKMMLEIISA